MELHLIRRDLYRVKHGQTLSSVARTFHVPLPLLCRQNALSSEAEEGTVLFIPKEGGNRYRVRGGESRELLCGSKENFSALNGTNALYVGQIVYLP